MQDTDNLSPESSPNEVSSTGVKRVNNMPLLILGGAVLIFLVVMVLVASDRAASQNEKPEMVISPAKTGNAQSVVNEIISEYENQTTGLIPAFSDNMPEQEAINNPVDLEPKLIAVQTKPMELQSPSVNNNFFQRDPIEDELNRIKMARIQRLQDAAMSNTSVQTGALDGFNQQPVMGDLDSNQAILNQISQVQGQAKRVLRNDPTSSYMAKLAAIKQSGMVNDPSSVIPDAAGFPPSLGDSGSVGEMGMSDNWKLDSKLEAPASPYSLRAGFVIPGVLISGINSDLPGSIIAQTSQDVYDTATGRYLLIPQGSRLMGAYESGAAYGQNRVLVAWQRIIFPDGRAMDIGGMNGTDSAGYSGFKDSVNNHYFRLFSSAILMSAVTAGISLSQNKDSDSNSDSTNASQAMSEALGQQLGQVTAQLISKNMNIAPTIEIRPGYLFNIIATKDLNFTSPYKAFNY